MNADTEPRVILGSGMPEGICTASDLVTIANAQHSFKEIAELTGSTACLWIAGYGQAVYMEAEQAEGDNPLAWNCRIWRTHITETFTIKDHKFILTVLAASEPPDETLYVDVNFLSQGKTYPEYSEIDSVTRYVLGSIALDDGPNGPAWLRQ